MAVAEPLGSGLINCHMRHAIICVSSKYQVHAISTELFTWQLLHLYGKPRSDMRRRDIDKATTMHRDVEPTRLQRNEVDLRRVRDTSIDI
jgi:hypothetical protein